ncbi:ankyrin [Podospora aff. communis PSN243]|uniref:Ankyrin n=1 Tax=Podospora aff. communis PSN243 TaxID=3040156 RepID=A0AAV9GWF5_9PEZI|nr:ankyrin [Podospora aff. communis PSN243]
MHDKNRDALPSVLHMWSSSQADRAEPDCESLECVLHCAISCGFIADVQAILDVGVPPTLIWSFEDRYNGPRYTTPLLMAALHGQRDVARLLWERVGPEGRFYPSNERNNFDFWSCIRDAAGAGHGPMVVEFLDMCNGWTVAELREALVAAAEEWRTDVVDLLLTRVTYTADDIQDALVASVVGSFFLPDDGVVTRQHETVCRLVTAGGDPNGNIGTRERYTGPLLIWAAYTADSLGQLTGLLKMGANPNIQDPANGQTALHQYRRHSPAPSSIIAAKALLESGASPDLGDHEGETPLHFMALAGTPEELKLYLDHCNDGAAAALRLESTHGETLLHFAAFGKNLAVVEFLIEHGLDVNAMDKHGWTPLVCALMPSRRRSLSAAQNVAKSLLQHGALANIITAENWTPMHGLASWTSRSWRTDDGKVDLELAKELISRGASLDAEAIVLRGKDVERQALYEQWGFRMQRFVEKERDNETESVPGRDTTPHMWAFRAGESGLFHVISDHLDTASKTGDRDIIRFATYEFSP